MATKAVKAIKEKEPKLPVVIMTAFGNTDTAIEATKLGAFDYLTKPVEPADLKLTLDRYLCKDLQQEPS